MASKSKHYGDISNWIEKVIESCETYQQTLSANRLLHHFEVQLREEKPDLYWSIYQYDIVDPLRFKLRDKRSKFISNSK
jgi:hypothetical protein